MRAAHAEMASRQHALRRGWRVRPDAMDAYSKAYSRLLDRGLPREQILAQLRPLYAADG